MPNPYQARGAIRVADESVSELDAFIARLRRLGATADEVASVREGWDDFDEDWTPDRRREFIRQSDDELRAALADVRDEYELGTTTEDEARAAERADRLDAALGAAHEQMGRTVGELIEWVGDDDARAHAVTVWETSEEGGGRKTLVAALADGNARWLDGT